MRRGRHRITMDVGPLGYPSIAAHGHADALAVTVSDGGRDLIGDPGTGSYYSHPNGGTDFERPGHTRRSASTAKTSP